MDKKPVGHEQPHHFVIAYRLPRCKAGLAAFLAFVQDFPGTARVVLVAVLARPFKVSFREL